MMWVSSIIFHKSKVKTCSWQILYLYWTCSSHIDVSQLSHCAVGLSLVWEWWVWTFMCCVAWALLLTNITSVIKIVVDTLLLRDLFCGYFYLQFTLLWHIFPLSNCPQMMSDHMYQKSALYFTCFEHVSCYSYKHTDFSHLSCCCSVCSWGVCCAVWANSELLFLKIAESVLRKLLHYLVAKGFYLFINLFIFILFIYFFFYIYFYLEFKLLLILSENM